MNETRLRQVLALDATTSTAAGAVALLAGDWAAERLGIDAAGTVRVVGAGLLLFALDVGLLATGRLPRVSLRAGARLVAAVNAAWVVASIAALAAIGFSTTGRIIVAVQALGVADFALLQWWFSRRLGSDPVPAGGSSTVPRGRTVAGSAGRDGRTPDGAAA